MKRAFTLIELLVVIAIMSILTIITVSQFQTAKRKANDVARKGDLNALAKALQMYYADYGKFPTSTNGLITVNDNGLQTTRLWGGTFTDNASPAYIYMKVMPQEKLLADFPYCYVADATGTKFGLFAMLENKADSQCANNGGIGSYSHCGGRNYCFAFVSPNTSISDLSAFVP